MRSLFLLLLLLPTLLLGQQKVLFDNTKNEVAGNADWIVDTSQPVPTPAQSGITPSTPESYWLGGISAWGVAMAKLGFTVHTLTSAYGITYGNASNAYDLSNYKIFIVCEPQNQFSAAEKAAILAFVQNGGGLMMVADHTGADRDNDGWDPPEIWNDLGSGTAFGIHFQSTNEANNNIVENCANLATASTDSIIHGAAGTVTSLYYHNGAAMTMQTANNPTAAGHIWMGSASRGATQVVAATARYGQGRVAGVGDSSPADDGTGQSGNTLFVGWDDPTATNDVVLLNLCLWLAAPASAPGPAAPALLSPADAAAGLTSPVTLRWTKPSGATGFQVDVATSNAFSSLVLTDSSLVDSTRSVGSLAAGTTYYWRARAKNASGWGAYSATRSFTMLAVPSAPGLVAPSNGAVNVPSPATLGWTKPSGATGYQLDVATSNTFASVFLTDSSLVDTLRSVGGLALGTTYYWRVRARNAAGWGAYGATRNFVSWDLPAAPLLALPADGAAGTPVPATLRWGGVATATGYEINVDTTGAFSSLVLADSTLIDTATTVPGLAAGGTYYWRVRARNGAGWGSFSVVRSFTTWVPPSSPVLVAPSDAASAVPFPLLLRWNAAATATGYEADVALNGAFSPLLLADSALVDTTRALGGLAANTTYYWRVRARNGAGWGAYGPTRSFTSWDVPPAPSLVAPADGDTGRLNPVALSWDAAPTADRYQVDLSLSPAFIAIAATDSTLTTLTTSISALAADSTYYWRVRARNSAGWGVYSPARTFSLRHLMTVAGEFASRWNLVSLPLRVADRSVATLFPSAVSPAYAFENGYAAHDSLDEGRGYWIKFPAAFADSLTGTERLSDTVVVHAGWNLIGTPSVPVTAAAVTSIPAGIIVSPFYGYDAGYTASTTLLPFRAYWVKCSADGHLVLR